MRARNRYHVASVLACALLVPACAGKLAGDESRYRVDPSEFGCAPALFQQRCADSFCHDSVAPTGGLDLESFGYRSRLVGVHASDPECKDRLLVDPAAPEKSFLLEKVSLSAPHCGEQMPLSGEPLSPTELACIRGFIDELVHRDGGEMPGPGRDASLPRDDASVTGRDASSPPPVQRPDSGSAHPPDTGAPGAGPSEAGAPGPFVDAQVDGSGGAG